MSRIDEKIVSDIRELLSNALRRNADELIASKGFRRMLGHINNDEEFRERMEESIRQAIEILELAMVCEIGVLDRESLVSLHDRISLVKETLEDISTHKPIGDKTGYTIGVVDEFDSLDDSVSSLVEEIRMMGKSVSDTRA